MNLPEGELWAHCAKCKADRFVTWLPMPIASVIAVIKAQVCHCGSKKFKTGKNPKVTAEGDPLAWLGNGDTGISSKTIWSVMMGRAPGPGFHPRIPWDTSDFGRCYRLLKVMPSWRARLPEVAARYPAWTALVREWDRLTEMYEAAIKRPDGMAREMYDAMKALIKESEAPR